MSTLRWQKCLEEGDVETASIMLEESPHLANAFVGSSSPLYIATSHGYANIVRLLLRHGASPTGLLGDSNRHPALLVACDKGFADVVEVLLDEGKVDPNSFAVYRHPVLIAARAHHLNVIKVLDKYGANLSVKNNDNDNAISVSCRYTTHPALVEYLVNRGVAADIMDSQKWTPLMYLANVGDVQSARVLVEKGGANLAFINPDGLSPLDIAERNKNSEFIFYCWQMGINPSHISTQSHMGELRLTRPRLIHSPAPRYGTAMQAIGSKIYAYGGLTGHEFNKLPVIRGEPVHKDQNKEEINETMIEEDSQKDGLQNEQKPEEEVEEMPQEQVQRDVNNRAAVRAPGMANMVLELFRGMNEADREALIEMFEEKGINVDDLFNHIQEDDEEDEENGNGTGEDEEIQEIQFDLASDDEDEVNDDFDDDADLRTSSQFYMVDIDTCEMKPIIPTGQMRPELKLIKLSNKKKGKLIEMDENGLGGCAITPPEDDSFPPNLIFADTPYSPSLCSFGYFEVHVINPGPRRLLTLGLVPEDYPIEGKQPGWTMNSFGIHGDDGATFSSSGSGESFADRFEIGDVIGCGVYWPTREVFFTQNGNFLGFIQNKIKMKECYACIGVRNPDAAFKINFGTEPFRFDFRTPTLSWYRIVPPASAAAPALSKPHLVKQTSNDSLVLFSTGADGSLQNTYQINLKTYEFKQVKATGNFPVVDPRETPQVVQIGKYVFSFCPYVQPKKPRTAGPFSPNTIPKFAVLGIFDTELLHWQTIEHLHESILDQAEYLANWQEIIAILNDADWSPCYMFEVQNKLVWTGSKNFLIADPLTGIYSIQALNTTPITYKTHHTAVGVENSCIAFAGWDGRRQSNELAIFNLQSGDWYLPAYSGIIPRERNNHSAVLVHSTKPWFLRDTNGLELSEPAPLVVQAFGWSGSKLMRDLDIISIRKTIPDSLLDQNLSPDFKIVVFVPSAGLSLQSNDSNGLLYSTNDVPTSLFEHFQSFEAHKVLLYCRSSALRHIFSNPPNMSQSSTIYIQLKDLAEIESFKGFLIYLYSDEVYGDPKWRNTHSRALVGISEMWAPEHSKKLMELLLLKRSTMPSQFGSHLKIAFENPLFSDLTLSAINPEDGRQITIPVHKLIICSRSAYFKALCYGGLSESKQETIFIPDVHPDALRLVVEFLYTYEVPYDRCSDWIIDMFILACRFQIHKLQSTLENVLVFNLTPENASSLLILGQAQSSTTLLLECSNYIQEHREEVEATEEFKEVEPQIMEILSKLKR